MKIATASAGDTKMRFRRSAGSPRRCSSSVIAVSAFPTSVFVVAVLLIMVAMASFSSPVWVNESGVEILGRR
jgi:hypothetical protein